MSATTTATRPSVVALYSGRRLVGFIHRRANHFEALDTKRRSLGRFMSQREAAVALAEAAEGATP